MTKKRVVKKVKKGQRPPQNQMYRRKRRKKRRRIKKSVLISFIAIVALVIAIFVVPASITKGKLKDLGYDSKTIKAIRDQKLSSEIIDNKYYSDYLAQEILNGTIKKDYLDLYSVRTIDTPLEDKDFLLYHRLLDRGYSRKQANNIFKQLRFYEITPLLVFDYQLLESNYIKDCLDHRETNSESFFELSNDYYTEYANSLPVDDPGNVSMLINKTYYLNGDYAPASITDLSVVYAASGVSLAQEAATAFEEWVDAGMNLGVRFYAASAYRPYSSQEKLYNDYTASMGQEKADALSARPGYSEHQTGLTVDVASVNSDGISEYKDTNEYAWTSTNCQDYGWILRYPEGKTQITGYAFESWHYRYVGKELAQAVVASKLTYDEYYCLYLKPWNDPALAYAQADQSQEETTSTPSTQDAQ
ncbi:MAG: M15 family metallopeptidase [Erysipelotrichaceae bacterium]|nr:M15 family metallopeptidase [Erysipelotrichaceae bacterium]MDY5252000.1 M15 family metallopeptidase [Erysipelotrichaceae bacterium]